MTTITCGTAHGNSFLIYLSWDPSPDCWRTCESFRWMFHTLSLPLSHFQTIFAPKTYEIHLLDDVSLCLFPSRKFLVCFSTPLPPIYPGVTLLELLMRNTDIMEKRNGLVALWCGTLVMEEVLPFRKCQYFNLVSPEREKLLWAEREEKNSSWFFKRFHGNTK